MSQTNTLNSNAYTMVGCDPWWRYHNLLVDVKSMAKTSPKVTLNSSRNYSRINLLNNGDSSPNKGANQVNVMPNNNVSISKLTNWANPNLYNNEDEFKWPTAFDWQNHCPKNLFETLFRYP